LHFTLSSKTVFAEAGFSDSPPAFSTPNFNSSQANQFARQFDDEMLLLWPE
jgi:hypothetical protein